MKHAGFLVNTGTSSRDYLDLVRHVQRIVGERAGVQLEPEIRIEVAMNQGDASATAWGCDLTYDYVRINGDYRT